MKISERLKDKRILIWGYGREGKSTERFIKNFCRVKSLDIFEGKADEIDESLYDYIIKSPGINVEPYSEKYTSQTELFLEEFSSQTVGITGTKGKSTTSTMTYRVLLSCLNENVLLVGNIGLPCLDYYDKVNKDTVIVYEMSCHQLNHNKFSPHIAVFLNLYEDHLDYYKTKENYFGTKKNITAHQSENDYFFYGDNVPFIETAAHKKMISFNKPMRFDMKLKGAHNQFNATFVYTICTEIFGCEGEKVKKAIEDFNGLTHRMEYVGSVGGIEFYNDSISTIPEATIVAINSIQNVKTVIIGGMDRHIHYDILVEFIKNHAEYNYILSYESGKRIYEQVSSLSYCLYENDLVSSVKKAKEITPEGCACLFSPAAASYGYFKNFEERGDAYKAAVLEF
ncbi:MAG: UDP-N-acetylmuramoyl-L-alanine--D-glutamate ligase [Clostridia bacterium]|nr:UDP-N-acetylmuramoyl-L-alanine--D-glutamate ligase [Clostridia bacterium]